MWWGGGALTLGERMKFPQNSGEQDKTESQVPPTSKGHAEKRDLQKEEGKQASMVFQQCRREVSRRRGIASSVKRQ